MWKQTTTKMRITKLLPIILTQITFSSCQKDPLLRAVFAGSGAADSARHGNPENLLFGRLLQHQRCAPEP